MVFNENSLFHRNVADVADVAAFCIKPPPPTKWHSFKGKWCFICHMPPFLIDNIEGECKNG